jgi:hypothetical protein
VKSFRLKASYFLCWCKESNQRKHQFESKPLKGYVVSRKFSDSPSWLGPKTPAIHGRRPLGLPMALLLVALESRSKVV